MEQYYVPISAIVKAEQVKELTKVNTPNGTMTAHVSDWILTDSKDKHTIVSNEIFQGLYYVARVRINEENKVKKMLKMIKG